MSPKRLSLCGALIVGLSLWAPTPTVAHAPVGIVAFAQTQVIVVPHGTYQVGTRIFGPVAVPVGLTNATVAFDRGEWTSQSTTITLNIDLSLDGGVTWNLHPDADPFPVGMEAEGGVALDKNGVPYTQSSRSAPLPQPGSSQRMVRGFITVAGGPITTTGTLTVQ